MRAEVLAVLDAQLAAISAKDLDAIMAPYAEDCILFDCKPPMQVVGRDAWRATWAACLPHFPAGISIERTELRIEVGGDFALAHYHLKLGGEGCPALRMTSVLRRRHDQWKIVHEHSSLPMTPPAR